MSKAIIMFPNNSISVMLGSKILGELVDLALFIPDGIHEQASSTFLDELILTSYSLNVSIEKLTTAGDFSTYRYVIFPSLDINPRKSMSDFGSMCANLFV